MGLIAPRGKQLTTSLPSFVSLLAPFSLNGLVRGGSMGSLSLIRPKCSDRLTPFPPNITIQSYTVSLVVTFNNICLCHIDGTKVSLCCRNLFLCLSLFWFFFRSTIYLANLNGSNIVSFGQG